MISIPTKIAASKNIQTTSSATLATFFEKLNPTFEATHGAFIINYHIIMKLKYIITSIYQYTLPI